MADSRHNLISKLSSKYLEAYSLEELKACVWDRLYDDLSLLTDYELNQKLDKLTKSYIVMFRSKLNSVDEAIGMTDNYKEAEAYIRGDENEFYILTVPELGPRED